MNPVRHPMRCALAALVLVPALASGAHAEQDETDPASRTEASQVEMPVTTSGSSTGQRRVFLDEVNRPLSPRPRREASSSEQITRSTGNAPASQISARGQGGSAVVQLSKADLNATLAQLSPGERRVLLQAIEGSDICDNPPNVAAIIALCQTRIETRASEFAALAEPPISAEDRLLRGELGNNMLPSIDQVIERLARGGAASGDLSNQAIASIALGATPAASSSPEDENPADAANLGEEAQTLINALINQLGGGTP